MKYSQQDLRQGMILRDEGKETPSSFGLVEGAAQNTAGDNQPKSRMAGQVGARVRDLMTNPEEVARTQKWMQQFGMSNEGYQFNQARMMMANPQPPADQESGPQE